MKKPIFIHIPKAGGTSIESIVRKHNKDLPQHCLHRTVKYYSEEERNSGFVFSFVRNPYDRLLSAHKYLTGGFGTKQNTRFGKTLSSNFKHFVKNELHIYMNNKVHFRPMTFWLNDVLDFIGKTENYEQDFNNVCDKIGIPRQKLPHKNKSKHKHYTEYYDDETREIVAEKYAKDIEYFGYKFGE